MAFEDKEYVLSAAVPAYENLIQQGYDVKAIANYLDFVNVMAYDFRGPWDGFADHHSPLHERAEEYSEAYKQLNAVSKCS